MVQKYTAPIRVYKYPFELVMAAYERRFPTCHLIPVFVGSDKIHENVSEDGSIYVIERRCRINVDAPYLLRKITGVDCVIFIQKNTLDRRKRVLKIEAWNESFSSHINIHELCHYKANEENVDWTIFEQQASLEVKSFWGFEHVVERLAVKHYSQNVKKGEEIIEYHIKELAEEGITFIPPFDTSLADNCDKNCTADPDDHQCTDSANKNGNDDTAGATLVHSRSIEQSKHFNGKAKNGLITGKSLDKCLDANANSNSSNGFKPTSISFDEQNESIPIITNRNKSSGSNGTRPMIKSECLFRKMPIDGGNIDGSNGNTKLNSVSPSS